MGKPGCHLRAVYCGTLAPATGGWWHAMIHGGSDGFYSRHGARRGPGEVGPGAAEIRRCNPLTWTVSAESFAAQAARGKGQGTPATTRLTSGGFCRTG